MSLEGKLLGNRYEIIEKVGNGGMATVYKAEDKILKRNVAVKILRDEFTTDEEFIKRFEVEAQSAAKLTHANIVSIYDVGVDGNLYFIVMELIQGKTLKEIIVEEKGPLPWKWSINVAMQISSALEMAHRNNIVHRDIKPHNIIITEDGVAKVTDFGIAKAVSNSTITAFGTTIGSVHYFSPEHARGGFTDAKSDLYSLGVVMYEMVTGKVPFDADTPVSVALKHMQEDPEEPIKLNPNIPVAVNKIIMKALQKDTSVRYQTATEMIEDLKKALKDPEGETIEDVEYDPTARTQVINTSRLSGDNKDNKRSKKEDNQEKGLKGFIKKHKKLSIFIGLILLFTLSFGGTMAVLNITNPPEVELPNVVGMSKEEAQKEVEAVKLKFEIEKEEYDKEVPEGYVISQDPTYMEKYNKVKEGSTVKVIISKGQEKATVPKVVGMKQDEAVKALEEAKLKVEIEEESSKKVEEGYVISQDTDPDTEVFAGDTVKIHVSTGTKKTSVPDVVGKQQSEAESILKKAGFTVNVTTEEDSSKEKGVVLRQSVGAGTEAEDGTAITIIVNSFEASKTVSATINVKSITGGYAESTEEGTEETAKTVKITITSGGKTLWQDSGVDKNTTNKTASISGKGSQEISLTITDTDGENWTRTKTVNFNNDTSITF